MKYSIIVPVYKNELSIPRLIQTINYLNDMLQGELEAVFVVDGSPDQSYVLLRDALDKMSFPAQLLSHSRNFGSFPAIRTGLAAARGEFFGVMSADLQETPELLLNFFKSLDMRDCDVVIGTRKNRNNDPLISRITSGLFWKIYRKLIVKDMPEGGVDVFGCNRQFRDRLLQLEESHSSLIALIFWLGFRRKFVYYERQLRQEGRSAWTLSKKIEYMMDSIFAFTDYPIRLLMRIGAIGSIISFFLVMIVILARLSGFIEVPGYAAIITSVLFLGALNLLGIGLVGTYSWRAYENSKRRPLAILAAKIENVAINHSKIEV